MALSEKHSQSEAITFLKPLLVIKLFLRRRRRSYKAGGFAGLTVDLILYPIDTLKTRLQSENGFKKSGGFSGVYKGIGAVMIGSVPSSALFFLTYEAMKKIIKPTDQKYQPFVHMLSACCGEVSACLVRVPTDLVKQRKQTYTGTVRKSNVSVLMEAFRNEGLFFGVYRGFSATLLRDLPFSLIQMPIWEYLKSTFIKGSTSKSISTLESALCGSIAGGIAAALTTPLDVIRTRIMLAKSRNETDLRFISMMRLIYKERGFLGMFAGITPRVTAFTFGGFIFLGAYEVAKSIL